MILGIAECVPTILPIAEKMIVFGETSVTGTYQDLSGLGGVQGASMSGRERATSSYGNHIRLLELNHLTFLLRLPESAMPRRISAIRTVGL